MNNARRKEIEALVAAVRLLKTTIEESEEIKSLSAMIEDVDDILSAEQEYLDGIPENMHAGDKYSTAEDAIENLQSAKDDLETIQGDIETAINSFDDVASTLESAQE